MIERMPKKVDENINNFCIEIVGLGYELEYIDFKPYKGYLKHFCAENVDDYIIKKGGSKLFGWYLTRCDNKFYQLFHILYGYLLMGKN